MALVLLVLGIVVAACGVAAMGFGIGIPVNEFNLGAALISGGSTALVGGFVLIGLSAVVSELGRLGDALKGPLQPAQRSSEAFDPATAGVSASPAAAPAPRVAPPTLPMPARSRPEPPAREMRPAAVPASPSSVDVSAAAIERLRSSIPRAEGPRLEPQVPAPQASAAHSSEAGDEAPLSPNGPAGRGHQSPANARAEPASPDPQPAPGERPGEAVEALKASRLDFLFRSKPARPPPAEDFEAVWPADAKPARNAPVASAGLTPETAEPRPSPPPPIQEPARAQSSMPEKTAAAILKSGVVDGMAYTLYTDGSIEAKLPEGTIKFGSVAELRAHIESNS